MLFRCYFAFHAVALLLYNSYNIVTSRMFDLFFLNRFNNVALQIIFLYDHLISNIGCTILRRSVDLGSSFRGRRTSSALHDEVMV
jgi:hypothetical protein